MVFKPVVVCCKVTKLSRSFLLQLERRWGTCTWSPHKYIHYTRQTHKTYTNYLGKRSQKYLSKKKGHRSIHCTRQTHSISYILCILVLYNTIDYCGFVMACIALILGLLYFCCCISYSMNHGFQWTYCNTHKRIVKDFFF